MEDNLKITGSLELILSDMAGQVKQKVIVPNLVVSAGKNFIASRMTGTPAIMSHMAVGSGVTAPSAANTELSTQIGSRVALTSSNATNNVVSYSASFAAGVGTGALTEAGIFNADSAGTMLCRTVFDVINKGSSDSLVINWNITIN
jgi:hypothetical protein